jgi:adenylosuccinate lyase
VQESAMVSWETDTSFRERVAKDSRIQKYLTPKELEHTFDLKRQLRYVDNIFDRVFGQHPAGERGVANKA